MDPQVLKEIEDWFAHQNPWLQYAAKTLYSNGEITDQDYENMQDLCIKEANESLKESEHWKIQLSTSQTQGNIIRIDEIRDIEGINKLNPKAPLAFDNNKPLSVIYGPNGSGKSGYVRLLKHVAGSRNPGNLLPDVFQGRQASQKCTIDATIDDNNLHFEWEKDNGSIDELRAIDIYDTFSGQTYLSNESEVTYEPPLLAFLSDLAEVEKMLSQKFKEQKEQNPSKLPELPERLNDTKVGQAINNLSYKTNPEQIKQYAEWTDDDETRLHSLNQTINEKLPQEKANEYKKSNENLISLILRITNLTRNLSDRNLKKLSDFHQKVIQKEEAAKAAAEKAFKNAPLEGVGSDIWNELWEKARAYSESHAYPTEEFPYTGEDAKCVLCQQPLRQDGQEKAKDRLNSFEEFVQGTLKQEANQLRKEFNQKLESLPDIPQIEDLQAKFIASGAEDEEIIKQASDLIKILRNRKEQITEGQKFEDLQVIPDYWDLLGNARRIAHQFYQKRLEFQESATSSSREKLNNQKLELEAKKWLSDNLGSILVEVGRLKKINELDTAHGLIKSGRLSRKKGEIAEEFITEEYKDRFNSELEALNAENIKVELEKTRTSQGKVLHQIKLQNLARRDANPEEILSEGENRIVSLAAFLADIRGNPYSAPIIFDDPVSSLDQEFEGFVAKRLSSLATERQVLVFTHRLSMLGLLQEKIKKLPIECKVIGLRHEHWGSGNPAELPIHKKNPESSLTHLLNERLAKARKALQDNGHEEYEWIAQAICSDFRLTIERTIERRLLSDVVERFSRVIHSDKIQELSKISEEDCTKLDDLMTKYSEFEHSQPQESPPRIPPPDELEADIQELLGWCKDFKKR